MYTAEQAAKDDAANLIYVKQQLIQLYGDQLKTQLAYSVYQAAADQRARAREAARAKLSEEERKLLGV